jgi:LPS export ABC transporter protein LptC
VPHVEAPGQITSYTSTLTGKDTGGRAYEIQAARSWQDKDFGNVFHLENVDATLHRAGAAAYRLTSQTAVYDSRTKIADVAGAVTITQGDRFTARMERAKIDMANSGLTSDSAVQVTTGDGTVTANGMQITDDGAHILFFNGVKAHFDASPTQGATP